MSDRYLGPAAVLDGKPVPADGLTVNYSEAQKNSMRDHGHRFASDATQRRKPTPAEVDAAFDAETGEADLAKAGKAAAAEKPTPATP